MSGGADDADKLRDLRRIEWTARVLQRLGDIIGEWEDCRCAGWVELEVAADSVILRSAAATFSRTLLTLAARLQPEGEGGCGGEEPLSAMLDELVETHARLGGEIVRHAMAAGLAVDRVQAGGAP